MLSSYILTALAHERHQALLARAETSRRAREARLHRQQAGRHDARRSPLRQRPAWLQPGRSRLFGHWPQSAVAGLLRSVRADLARREPGALRYEIILGSAEERGCVSSAAKGGVARGRPGAEEVGE
jgi:hypothetical protein